MVEIVPDMHKRKERCPLLPSSLLPSPACMISRVSLPATACRMAVQADAFVALPGGFGTLEEFLEVITWSQLGYHTKPIGLLNACQFFDPLLAFFKHCVDEVGGMGWAWGGIGPAKKADKNENPGK